MKKLLVLFFLIVLMYNSIGFIINFQFVLTEWRQEMKHFLSNKSADTPLTRLVFDKNNFDTSAQEFSKDNFRYDVVKTEIYGDSIVVYCFRDDKETRLAENFSEQLFENTSDKYFFSKKFQKNFLKEFFFEKIFVGKKIIKLIPDEKNIFCYAPLFLPEIFLDVMSAPPEV